jgi:uncharacterized protein
MHQRWQWAARMVRIGDTQALLLVEIGLAVLLGIALLVIGAGGGAWIFGGIAAGAIALWFYRARINPEVQPNRTPRKVGQVLVGLTVGLSIQQSQFAALSAQMPLFLLLTVVLLALGVGIGYLYAELEKTDVLTALLATTPGNLGVMGSIAADYQRDAALVSLVQLLRFTLVTLLIPLVADVSHEAAPLATLFSLLPRSLDGLSLLWLLAILSVATLAVRLGTRYKIPVATLLCAIAVGIGFNPLLNALPGLPAIAFTLPPALSVLGQILLGLTIGECWAVHPRLSSATLVRSGVPVVLTMVAGLVTAAIAHFCTQWDWLTCLLVAAPGGSPEMIWIALTLNHSVEVVTAGHLVRLIAINLALPSFVALAAYLDGHRQTQEESSLSR